MSSQYDPRAIEKRWQAFWLEKATFATPNPGEAGFDASRPKYYVLDMFPYPSGAGLHVGHPVGYIGSDIVARRQRMCGFNVLHPMGWDAFGLPAEQYAIQTGKHPAETTRENVDNFRRQLQLIGLSFDWKREVNTSHVDYYRWTQWLFTRLYDQGLVYQTEVPVWWCEELKTVLANEEVINGRSERGNHPCVRRPLKQWMFKITAYADRLLDDLELVDWPESIKAMQRDWIGRSEGAAIVFPVEGYEGASLEVFTTRPDTLWGATFMVVAPEHPLVESLTTPEQRGAVETYVRAAANKSDLERTDLAKEKTGVATGAYALNPLMDPADPAARIPIWIADYVLYSYGTGAIMAVPGHDERDHEFATRFELPIVEVVHPPEGTPGLTDGVCFTGDGVAVNSGPIDGLETPAAKARTLALLRAGECGEARVTYKLRDWLFSRQRYWGEPFPIRHLADGTHERVPDDELPVVLPEMDDFTPSANGSPPLARAEEWVMTHGGDGSPARRDTDTMPGWAGSCWYYLRFMDPHNDELPFSPEAQRYWGAVDLYIGGASHAVMHLLYARFWHKVFYDIGLVEHAEPFATLFNQGMLNAPAYEDADGRRFPANEVEERDVGFVHSRSGTEVQQITVAMSKSVRNVINPDDVIEDHGADAFRLYEMFMAPLSDTRVWDTNGIAGCRRFLDRLWKLFVDPEGDGAVRTELLTEDSATDWSDRTREVERALNQALKRVDDSFQGFNFNTAVSGFMTFLNEVQKRPGALVRSQADRLVRMLAPFAPHIAEELWERLGHEPSVGYAPWPEIDADYLVADEFELVVQVMGRVRGRARVAKSAGQDDLAAIAKETVSEWLEGKTIVKTVVVPGRLVNFVVR